MKKHSVFNYPVKLVPLKLQNNGQAEFRESLFKVPYLLYDVENISDGRKIAINKPGGKRNFGRLSRNDFMVFIYNPTDNELWLISHNEIYEDLVEKSKESSKTTIKIIDLLHKVCDGFEPDDLLSSGNIQNLGGIEIEVLLKVYKWIWGQEDCNYPNGEGRWLSMNSLINLKNKLIMHLENLDEEV